MKKEKAGRPLEFVDQSLAGATFSNVDLSSAKFTDAGLVRASFSDINFDAARIANSNLTSVCIDDCNLTGMTIDGILLTDLFDALRAMKASKSGGRKLKAERQPFSAERYAREFQQAVTQLQSKSWFKSGGWLAKPSLFPAKSPRLATLHLFKAHWFNEGGQGIHIETYVGAKEDKARRLPVMVHLLHTPIIPGTKIKRTQLSKLVVDEIFDTISEWDGYVFRAGRYGTQPFTHHIEFNDQTLPAVLVTQLARLCRTVGPVVDRALKALVS